LELTQAMDINKTLHLQGNPYRKYQMNSIETASPLMLVLMLYNEAIKMCQQALSEFGKNREGVHNKLIKAQKIVTELTIALNMEVGGELAENLKSLYVYIHTQLVQANVEQNADKIQEVLKILTELREAWNQVTVEHRRNVVRQAGYINTTE